MPKSQGNFYLFPTKKIAMLTRREEEEERTSFKYINFPLPRRIKLIQRRKDSANGHKRKKEAMNE